MKRLLIARLCLAFACLPAGVVHAQTTTEAAKADGTVRRAFDAHGMADAEVAPAGSRS